ncbi:MAG: bifunctional serine/threonine-protein kinase/formylglycine-generating enzyme family protein [Planctomycetota bacterium]
MAENLSLESIFGEAFEIETPALRAAFLDEACKGDAALRGQIEALLRAEENASSSFLEPDMLLHTSSGETIGAQIGPYKLLQILGEGGMGSVYRAEQTHPVRRTVALKVIKAGMDSAKVIGRFEAERQALAMMDHENIARVFDGGTTPSGQPYFVMELVEGTPLTSFCDESRVTLRGRLQLFIQVCKAIQHAHQKGIIHRDIKPSNVLATFKDDELIVKVIDFGVAKAIDQKLTDVTQVTSQGVIIGTLEYMSPEQAGVNPEMTGVDARADIYALGVLLYELLTGTTPLERARIKNAGLLAVLERIRLEDPPRPSVRITKSQAAAKNISETLQIDPKKYAHAIAGDLDWIVMKALEKDRTRRYETVNGLARDIERHLTNQPVEARPTSAGYRAEKFVSKNKGVVAAIAAVMLSLLAGIAVAYQKAKDEAEQRRVAVAALKEQKRLTFEAVVRNAEADSGLGESENVIAELTPFLMEKELAEHPLRGKCVKLVEKAQDGYTRFAAFNEQVKKHPKSVSLDLGHGVMLELILIPAGKYMMGGKLNANEVPHPVTITKPFYMGRFAVTQEQYETVVGTNPSLFKGPQKPVESVTWFDAVAFCEKLNKQAGTNKVAFALPTEAQWEYACRGGTTTEYYFGDDATELEKYAWYEKNAGIKSGNYGVQPVGGKPANPFGLYDMHGNVDQWCQDWYDADYYKNSPKEDPSGPKEGVVEKSLMSVARVLRGGSYDHESTSCRCANRSWDSPTGRYFDDAGFRCVLVLPL